MIHPVLSLKEKTPDGYFSVLKIVAIIVKIRVILWTIHVLFDSTAFAISRKGP